MEKSAEPKADVIGGVMVAHRFVQYLPGSYAYVDARDAAIGEGTPVTLISASGHECDLLPFTGAWVGPTR